MTYRMSTGFEAVWAVYLHMTGLSLNLKELIDWCIQQVKKEESSEKISESGFLMQR